MPKSVDPRIRQMLSQIAQILNEGEYECKVTTATPTASSAGFQGEKRLVVSGATMRSYEYANSNWWYSELYTSL